MFLVFRTSLEVLQRNNFIPLCIYCPLCWSEGFPTEQGYLVTEVRGIFELFLVLDPRSPCLALFPYPCFSCSWARPSASCLACTCLQELTLVPVFLPFYLFFSSWNWFSVLTHNKNGIFKVFGLLPGISLEPHIQCQKSDVPGIPLVFSVGFSILCSVMYNIYEKCIDYLWNFYLTGEPKGGGCILAPLEVQYSPQW